MKGLELKALLKQHSVEPRALYQKPPKPQIGRELAARLLDDPGELGILGR